MLISRLRITQFRNIGAADLELGRVNVLTGVNGSGKTSALESIFLLGTGRSFRSVRPELVINHDAHQCSAFAALFSDTGATPVTMGVSRDRDGRFEGRIQGQPVSGAAELARRLPLQLINAETFDLLQGGPKIRRQFLDWGVFHVEHGFHGLWTEVQRLLRQRNALLRRDRISAQELEPWDAGLALVAEQLNGFRRRYFDAFLPLLEDTMKVLLPLEGLQFGYQRGWDGERPLAAVLREQVERDRERGFTNAGPHRADIRVRVQGLPADEVLSRGQQKLVVCAMKLAQARLFTGLQSRQCVFLIDDLPAELDAYHRRELCGYLARLGCQVLVSCVDAQDMDGCWRDVPPAELKVFHVEHGAIRPHDRQINS